MAILKTAVARCGLGLVLGLTAAAAVRAQESATSDRDRRVEMPAYSVGEVAEGGWKVERDEDHQAIRFTRTRKYLLSKVQVTMLLVMRDSSPAEHWGLSARELADSLRSNEVAMLTGGRGAESVRTQGHRDARRYRRGNAAVLAAVSEGIAAAGALA